MAKSEVTRTPAEAADDVLRDVRAALRVLIMVQLSQQTGQLPEVLRKRVDELITAARY